MCYVQKEIILRGRPLIIWGWGAGKIENEYLLQGGHYTGRYTEFRNIVLICAVQEFCYMFFKTNPCMNFFGDIFYSLNIAILAPFGLDSTLSYITSHVSMKEMKKLCTDLSFKELSGMTILWLCQNCQLFTWKSMILVSCITLMIKVTR